MSTLIRARHGGHDQQLTPARAQQRARALGLTSATGLVIAGSEPGRGRGGPRCMTCPIERDPG